MLSDVAIRNAKPRDADYKLTDSRGLYLLVRSNGSRLWRWNYRFQGRQKTMALGSYPDVGLSTAREKHQAARAELANGLDPMRERHRSVAVDNSFEAVARRWLEARKASWSDKYYHEVVRRLEDNAFANLGRLPINSIEPPELLRHIRDIEKRGVVYTAKRVKNHCGEIFRFAIAEGLCSRDPSADIRGALQSAPPVQHHSAIPEAELPNFLQKLYSYDLDEDTRDALMFTLLTASRTSEVRFAHSAEFEAIDGPEPIWRISAARMKMNRTHLVPLSRQALELVERRLSKNPNGFLFARPTRTGTLSENTMLYGLYRLGYHSRATVHGLRGTFSTIAHEHDWDSDWIEMSLAHVDENKVRSSYNAAKYLKQRRQLLQWWADFLDVKRLVG